MIELFYVVAMNTKNGKMLYLKEGKNNNYEWTFNYNESLWFTNEEETKLFALNYFNNFKNWFVKEISFDICSM